ISTAGSYSVLPSDPVAQGSTSGAGTGATFNINTWGLTAVTVSAGGTGYDSGSDVTFTGGGGSGGAAATITLGSQAGNAVTVPVAFAANANLPAEYGVFVNPGQDC